MDVWTVGSNKFIKKTRKICREEDEEEEEDGDEDGDKYPRKSPTFVSCRQTKRRELCFSHEG